jgi:hypothetical protein
VSRRALIILLAACGALLMVAALGRLGDGRAPGPEPFLPELAGALGELTGVVVTGPGNQIVATLAQKDGRWVVREAGDYPADVGRLRQNLQALAEARRLEEKTSSAELYGRLGVADVTEAGSRALQLAFAGPKPVPTVLIGDMNVGGGDRAYARRAGDATSWLVSGKYDFGRSTADWLDKLIVDLPADQVKAVSVTHPGVETLRISRADAKATDFTVDDVPTGKNLSFDGVGNSVGAALGELKLDGVAGREALGTSPPKPIVARFETFGGLIVEASGWRLADGTRFTFQASAPADQAEAKQAADAINAKVAGWVYTLPAFKAELLTRRMQDLLQPE